MTTAVATQPLASDRQIDFHKTLISRWAELTGQLDPAIASEVNELALADIAEAGTWTKVYMSGVISDLIRTNNELTQELRAAVKPEAELTAGIYRHENGELYRLKPGKGSGNLYAQRVQLPEVIDGRPTGRASFHYAPGIVYQLTMPQRLTVKAVEQIALDFSICVVCGAILTATKSKARGIGPVCITKV